MIIGSRSPERARYHDKCSHQNDRESRPFGAIVNLSSYIRESAPDLTLGLDHAKNLLLQHNNLILQHDLQRVSMFQMGLTTILRHLELDYPVSELQAERIRFPFFRNKWIKMKFAISHAHAAKPFYYTHPGACHRGNVTTFFRVIIV